MIPSTFTGPATSFESGRREPLDVRPILTRTADNAWERNEHIRSTLYTLLEGLCAKRGIEALVLQSNPYEHPAWVRFESWLPANEPGITARASMTVSISTKPCHRFEAIYKVDWQKHGRSGAIDQLYEFGEPQMTRMVDFLSAEPAPSLPARQVNRILRPVQLRQQGWHFWKPRNKVTVLRRDWVATASVLSVILGTILLFLGLQTDGSPFDSQSSLTSTTESATAPVDLAPLAPPPDQQAPASQAPDFELIAAGRPILASLVESAQRFDDGRLYEARRFVARAGQPLVITLQSADFDTYLLLGQFANGTFQTLRVNDDGGNDGTNSQLEFVPSADGEYIVIASSYEPGKSGRYTLVVR